MPVITGETYLPRVKRVLFTLEDGRTLRVPRETAVRNALCIGASLTEEQVVDLLRHKGVPAADAGAAMLARRPYSVQELRRKLAERGYTEEEQSAAVERLLSYRLLDDAAYAAAVLEYGVARQQPRRAIFYDLLHRGIDRALADEVMEHCPDDAAPLDALIAARLRGQALDRPLREKTMRYYIQRGFSAEDVRAALGRYAEQLDAGEFTEGTV